MQPEDPTHNYLLQLYFRLMAEVIQVPFLSFSKILFHTITSFLLFMIKKYYPSMLCYLLLQFLYPSFIFHLHLTWLFQLFEKSTVTSRTACRIVSLPFITLFFSIVLGLLLKSNGFLLQAKIFLRFYFHLLPFCEQCQHFVQVGWPFLDRT